MSRFINPVPEYRSNSSLYFFKSGTNTRLTTYADENQNIPNPHPIVTDSLGNVPNVFYQGSAKLVVTDETGEQYISRDPVGGEKELGDFTLFDTTVSYDLNDIVEGSDGNFYQSLTNANQSNDPVTSPVNWELINFVGTWNTNINYTIGIVVKTTDGNLWKSQSVNAGNNPVTDDGTNWKPAVNEALILEPTNTVEVKTGGGALSALVVNELQDAGAYTLPAASSINANQVIIVSQPDEFKALAPTVTADGSDTISYSGGSDTVIEFDNLASIDIRLTSDGVSNWRLTL